MKYFLTSRQWRAAKEAHDNPEWDPTVCQECGAPALDGTCDFCRRLLLVAVARINARFDQLEYRLLWSLIVFAVVVYMWRLLIS